MTLYECRNCGATTDSAVHSCASPPMTTAAKNEGAALERLREKVARIIHPLAFESDHCGESMPESRREDARKRAGEILSLIATDEDARELVGEAIFSQFFGGTSDPSLTDLAIGVARDHATAGLSALTPKERL